LKPKLIALNVLLLAALVVIAWEGRAQWKAAQRERAVNLNAKPAPPAVKALPPAAPPAAAQPVQYADVATKDLFAKDRNPNVIIDPPKIEAPKPMPALPVVYGVLGLPSGTRAIMAVKQGVAGKSVHEGDQVGEFKIVSLDPKTVVFDWDGTQISRKIDDLIDRSAASPANGGSQGPAIAAPPPPVAAPLGPPKSEGSARPAEKPCVAGDNSPAGTVADGYKKAFAAETTPFGPMGCHWVLVQ
jgi:hypothetical protein